MPRSRSVKPTYAYHVSGQARVYLDGKYYYLGEHDSPASRAKYHQLCALYASNNYRMPDELPEHQEESPITVGVILAEWKAYNAGKSAVERYKPICDVLELEYGDVPAEKFGPKKLKRLRETMVSDGKCSRKWLNEQIRAVVRIFKHSASEELIKNKCYQRLTTVEPLSAGESSAREQFARSVVPLDVIAATVKELSPTLAAMVRVQLGTGMRSGELTGIRPVDMDRSGDEWVYRPEKHKTSRHGIKKQVPILGAARDALEPFMHRPDESYCFSPAESDQWFRDQRRANRTTPLKYEKRVFKFEQIKNPRYRSESYRQAIVRAAGRAGVEIWTPAQIRHTTATEIYDAIGIEEASALLGHTTVGMTEHYARMSLRRAVAAAKAGPKLS
ncbi:MAG: site-specific integrase [Planctomycetota bacterium]